MKLPAGLAEKLGVLVVLVLGVSLPFILGQSAATLGSLDAVLSLTMLVVGMNIVLGFAGQLFLGPTALYAAGGYLAAYLATHYVVAQSLWAMCASSVAISLVIAAVVAIPALRIGGFYLGMTTLFLALVIPTVANQIQALGATDGLSLYASPSFVQKPSGVALYEVGAGIVALIAVYSWLIRNSRLGRRMSAIRSSDVLAQSVGIAPYRTKMVTFLLAAVPSGIAGAFYVYSQEFITPGSASPNLSIVVLAGLVIGGSGTIVGPIIGVAVVSGANQFFGSFDKYQGLIYGALLVVVAAIMPDGVVGTLKSRIDRLAGKGTADGPAAQPPEAVMVSWIPKGILGAANDWLARYTARNGSGAPESDPAGDLTSVTSGGAFPVLSRRGAVPPLRVDDVRRAFGGVQAVAGVDLTVEPGKVHALVGPNGSGKTTLLNLICGYYRVGGGQIYIGDQRLDTQTADRIAQLGIARTFQTPRLLTDASALENVVLGGDRCADASIWGAVLHTRRARGADRKGIARAVKALRWVGVGDQPEGMAGVMSHGTQRLVEIARAVMLEPAFLLLDEPAAGLSIAEVESLKNVVRAVADAGLGVLLVEHNLPVVLDLADAVTVLHQGKVIATGSPAQVSANPDVIEVYLGRNRLDGQVPTVAPKDAVP
jgi:branched-chain amino acid transport system permease protein